MSLQTAPTIRDGLSTDAQAISAVLEAMAVSSDPRRPYDSAWARAHYLGHPDQLSLLVAVDVYANILGFQSLKQVGPDNEYNVPAGWGVIGTHIVPAVHRRGVGHALFIETRRRAYAHGLKRIDATIGANNSAALAYYNAMGFRRYAADAHRVRKCLKLE